jgi:hypothetical protein
MQNNEPDLWKYDELAGYPENFSLLDNKSKSKIFGKPSLKNFILSWITYRTILYLTAFCIIFLGLYSMTAVIFTFHGMRQLVCFNFVFVFESSIILCFLAI